MSADLIFRIIGMLIFSTLGAYAGNSLAGYFPGQQLLLTIALGVVGGLLGLWLTPYLTTHPARGLRTRLASIPAEALFSGLMGLVAGLLISALLAFPLS